MRRAGRDQKYHYFYIGHYDANKKMKDWCQIKLGWQYAGLADIEFADPRYPEYKLLLETITRHHWAKGGPPEPYDADELQLMTKGYKFLHEFGWPSRWAYIKFVEDWKKMSQTLQSRGPLIPINNRDKNKRRANKEYRKSISHILLMLSEESVLIKSPVIDEAKVFVGSRCQMVIPASQSQRTQ